MGAGPSPDGKAKESDDASAFFHPELRKGLQDSLAYRLPDAAELLAMQRRVEQRLRVQIDAFREAPETNFKARLKHRLGQGWSPPRLGAAVAAALTLVLGLNILLPQPHPGGEGRLQPPSQTAPAPAIKSGPRLISERHQITAPAQRLQALEQTLAALEIPLERKAGNRPGHRYLALYAQHWPPVRKALQSYGITLGDQPAGVLLELQTKP